MTLGVQRPPLPPRAIGAPLDRIDGPLKVTGAAKYAYEYPVAGITYVFPVQSTIAKGKIVSIDASAAQALPGVLAVLSHENAPRLHPVDIPVIGQRDQDLAVFQSDVVTYRGQVVAAVVAETLEVARQAASLVTVRYEEQPHDVELRADRGDLYAPETLVQGTETDTTQGDIAAALAAAPVSTDRNYAKQRRHARC
jgi:xanthine dehydrogenase YagR molybdenum-binding subunit